MNRSIVYHIILSYYNNMYSTYTKYIVSIIVSIINEKIIVFLIPLIDGKNMYAIEFLYKNTKKLYIKTNDINQTYPIKLSL